MEKLELRHEVEAFAQAMERQLRKNDHKGGWSGDSFSALGCRLMDEWGEVRATEERRRPPSEMLAECADVANFAMMIADNYYRDYVEAESNRPTLNEVIG